MKETGTRAEVLTKKARATKKGESYETLVSSSRRNAVKATKSDAAKKSNWTTHVRAFAAAKGVSFAAALGDSSCKSSYTKKTK